MAETDTKQIIHTPAVIQKQGVERAFLSLGQPRILRQAGAPLDFFSEAPSGFPWTPPPPQAPSPPSLVIFLSVSLLSLPGSGQAEACGLGWEVEAAVEALTAGATAVPQASPRLPDMGLPGLGEWLGSLGEWGI